MAEPPIPPFQPNTLLPEGLYECVEETFQTVFVDNIPGKAVRSQIWQGLKRLRTEAVEHGIHGLQWIDGSMVTSIANPGDVDVVTFVDSDLLNHLTQDARDFLEIVIKGEASTKLVSRAHSMFVAVYPVTHPWYRIYEDSRSYWRKWFGQSNPKRSPDPPEPKGFVKIVLGESQLAPEVSDQ